MKVIYRFFRVWCPAPARAAGIVLILLFASLALWSCGDEEAEAPTLSADDLRSMVIITSEGLPWEFDLVADEAVSTADAVAELPNPEQWEERYDEWQRAGGHWAQFQPEQDNVLSVETEVEYYRSSEGARPAWEAVSGLILSSEWKESLMERGLSSVSIEEVDADEVGEGSVAVRMDVRLEEQISHTYVVLFYRDGILASASVGAQGEAGSIRDAVDIAELMDSHIENALND